METYKKFRQFKLAKGLDVDGANHVGGTDVTPLQAAVMYNDVRRVNFLLEYGADIHLSEGYGMTPIEIARKFDKAGSKLEDRREIIQILSDANNTKPTN